MGFGFRFVRDNNLEYVGVKPPSWDFSVGISGTVTPYSFGSEIEFPTIVGFLFWRIGTILYKSILHKSMEKNSNNMLLGNFYIVFL